MKYDGNIIGGALVGAGMILTGACPGTIFVQLAIGLPSSGLTLAGAVAGGAAYTAITELTKEESAKATKSTQCDECLTVHDALQVDRRICLAIFGAICTAVIAATMVLDQSKSTGWAPVLGGLYIGFSQLAALTLTGLPVGVSAVFEELGAWTWTLIGKKGAGSPAKQPLPPTRALFFSAGLMLGSWMVARMQPAAVKTGAMYVSPIQAVTGGAIMIVGARVGGGCTSGHGISGMSMFCLSSIVTVASMFAGGIGLGMLISHVKV